MTHVRWLLPVCLCVLILTGGCSTISNTASLETIPGQLKTDSYGHMTVAELLKCRTDLLLLEGSATETEQTDFWEVRNYQQILADYQANCANKRYVDSVFDATEAHLDPQTKQHIKDSGVRRVAWNRVNRQVRHNHVSLESTVVYPSGHPAEAQVETLSRWQDVFVLDEETTARVAIEWVSNSLPKHHKTGWVAKEAVASGSGVEARTQFCLNNRGQPVAENEILHGNTSQSRFPMLSIRNPASQDAYIKLIGSKRNLVAAFIVEANASRVVHGLPTDIYELWFVTGEQFSRGCDSFAIRGVAARMQNKLIYDERTLDWEVRLEVPSTSPLHADLALYREFEQL